MSRKMVCEASRHDRTEKLKMPALFGSSILEVFLIARIAKSEKAEVMTSWEFITSRFNNLYYYATFISVGRAGNQIQVDIFAGLVRFSVQRVHDSNLYPLPSVTFSNIFFITISLATLVANTCRTPCERSCNAFMWISTSMEECRTIVCVLGTVQ